MRNESPVGLTRSEIETVLERDEDVLRVERIESAKALWRVSYSFEGQPPMEMLIDNGIDESYVQVLVQIDAHHLDEALSTLEPFGTVGLAMMDGMLLMRSGLCPEHSNAHALIDGYRAVAFAHFRYREAIRSAASQPTVEAQAPGGAVPAAVPVP
ncbi:MAG: hypothetical protein Q4E05_06615 [Pseudoclavibacter sp.]|nr:hypothetical protein [Pseudoclavibacter sp.]